MTVALRSRGFLLAPVIAVMLMGQGCLGGSSSTATGPDGGVFRTRTLGTDWQQLKVLNLENKFGSIADIGTVNLAVDPQDDQTMYVGTSENGLIYTLDGGSSWRTSKGLSFGQINAIAVDPKNKCVVYAARANQLFKTENCLRDWNEISKDSRTTLVFTALTIDWFHPSVVYAGTSQGDIFRSDNGGVSWRVAYRVDSGTAINQLAIDPRDSRTVYAATNGAGIVKSNDGGNTWESLSKTLQAFDYAQQTRLVVLDPHIAQRVYHISKYGILRSDDGGASWTALTLPTPKATVAITSFGVNPKDPQSKWLAYTADSTLALSNDGGATWTSRKLPTKRGVSFLNYDNQSPQGIYIGASKATQ